MRLSQSSTSRLLMVMFTIARLSGLAHGNPLSSIKKKLSTPTSSPSPSSQGSPPKQDPTDPAGPAAAETKMGPGSSGANDILGMGIGMDQKQVVAALKKHNPKIEIHVGKWEMEKGQISGTEIRAVVRPSSPGSIAEQFTISLTPDTNAVSYKIYRAIRGSMMKDQVLSDLNGKYGSNPVVSQPGKQFGWHHDSTGRDLPPCARNNVYAAGVEKDCAGILITTYLQGDNVTVGSVETTVYDVSKVSAFVEVFANALQSKQDNQKRQQLEAAKANRVQY
jgi:hypothetical protein